MTDKPTPTTDLLKRCAEIHEWRSTGVLSGEALRDYAKRKWPDRHDTLQMAEHETVTEALALLAKWGQPAAEPSRFGSPELQAMTIARCVEKDQADSGFDHKTAADFLNGKTVSDEAVRKFVATSRWAHDERAALSATLLAMHGVLTSREAEIALLKKALLEAEAAPQQEPASPIRIGWGRDYLDNGKSIDAGAAPVPDFAAILQQGAQEPVAWLNPWRADQVTTDYDAYGERGIPLYTAPQPAPAPLSDDVVKDVARWRMVALIGNELMMRPEKRTHATAVKAYMDATHSGSDLTGAVDAAIAAQGGK